MRKESLTSLKPEYTVIKSSNHVLPSTVTTEELCDKPLKSIILTNGSNIYGLSEEVLEKLRSLDPEKQKEAKEILRVLFRKAEGITVFHRK